MIECNYELKRKEGNKENIYKPNDIIKTISNISYIKAPNSWGKSTYLNLIALCFWGYKNDSIDPDLKKSIENLLVSENQQISFQISISSRNGDIQIIAKKDNFESKTIQIEEVRNGKRETLTPVNIDNKYKIIYDLPRNPRARLKQLLDEVKEEQQIIGNRTGDLRNRIQEILQEIQDSKDPEFIASLEKKEKELESDLNVKKQLIEKVTKEKSNLEKYYYLRFYHEYKLQLEEMERTEKNVQKNINKEKRKKTHSNNEYNLVYNLTKDEIERMKGIMRPLTNDLLKIIPEKKGLIQVWERIDLDKTLDTYQLSDTFINCLLEIDRLLCEKSKNNQKNKDVQEAEIYLQIMKILENYIHLDIKLGFGNKSIKEFYEEIKRLYRTKHENLSDLNNIRDALTSVNNLEESKRLLIEQYLPNLIKAREKISPDDIAETKKDRDEVEQERYYNKKKEIIEKVKKYQANYQIIDSPSERDITDIYNKDEINTLDRMKESLLKDKIDRIQNDIAGYKTEESDYIRRIRNLRDEIIKLTNKKEHPYKVHQKYLEKIGETVKKMVSQINVDYTDYLKQIREERLNGKLQKEQEKYTSLIFEYLGKRMGKITIHTGETIHVKKVDLFKGILETPDGGEYYLNQMGTGQTQAAYLKSLLSTEDDRLIIAMFDEVGMMDEKTLSQVKEQMIKLYDSNRLLLGLIVQKKDECPEIIDLEKIK